MKEVAELAGVSIGTVSFVVNGTRSVLDSTRVRVEAAMKQLEYQPNVLAQGLASRKSKILALVLPLSSRGIGATQMEYVVGASEKAQELGYNLVLWPISHDGNAELASLSKKGLVDGVILMEVSEHDQRAQMLNSNNLPYVAIGRTDLPDEKYVDIDFESTIREGVEHLMELGHTDIAFINHSQKSLEQRYGPTWRASEILVKKHPSDIRIQEFCSEEDQSSGHEIAARILRDHPEITAFLIMNEEASFGISHEIQDQGFQIPEDYSIVLLVSSPGVANQHRPTMTAVPAPGRELGTWAAEMLIAELNQKHAPVESHLYNREIVLGQSTAQARVR